MRTRERQHEAQPTAPGERRITLAGSVGAAAEGGAVYGVTALTAGTANGWRFTPSVLERAVAEGLFERRPSFLDHRHDPTLLGTRSVRDLCGVVYAASFDPAGQAVRALFRTLGPVGESVDQLVRQVLADRDAGRPVPAVGLSVDVSFEAGEGQTVTRITRVHSVDVVYQPAAGGAFETVLSQQVYRQEEPDMSDSDQTRGAETRTQEGGPALSQALLAQQAGATLAATLAASDLPQPLREELREEFAGRVFEPAQLEAAIERKRVMLARLAEAGVVRGVGGADGRGAARVGGMWTDLDRVGLAVERFFGLPLPDTHSAIPRLTGIRELYHLVTGDYNLHGVFDPTRATFANANAATMAGLVASAMNKVIAARTAELGRAGYDWFRRIAHEEDFGSLQDVRWITVGGFGDLPSVSEGAAYTELTWDDATETASWTKKGGYLGLTLEMIDRDDSRRVRAIPNLLATAAIRTLSAAVAAIFTQNSFAGPTLADSTALFHSSRGNAGSATLNAAGWDGAVQAMYAFTELNSGRRLGLRPRFLLVPIELEKTALQIFVSPTEPSSNAFYTNVRESGAQNVVTCPEFTDATAWFAVADPNICPGIGIGYRFGRQPEVFVADQPEVGSMFTNDEMRVKVRFFYSVGVVDWRGLYRGNT